MQYCSNCGLPLRDNDNFCNNCGKKISKTSVYTDTVKAIETDDSIFSKVESILKSRSEIITFAKKFPTEDVNGRKGNVDYIALTDRGIFIFNIVPSIGKITSTSNKHIWECNSIQFPSPIDKSLKDIDSVKSFFIKRKFTNIFSYIIFPNGSDIGNVSNEKGIRICTVSSLPQKMKDDIRQYGQIYSNQDIREVSRHLSQYSSLEKNEKAVAQHTLTYTNSKIELSRLIIGVVFTFLSILIFYQSYTFGNDTFNPSSVEAGKGAGIIISLNILMSGLISIFSRRSDHLAPWIIVAILLCLNGMFAASVSGTYYDLKTWGIFSVCFAEFYLLTSLRNRSGKILITVLIVLWMLLCISFASFCLT